MATGTYALIASTTGTGSSNVITFSSIPATFTDLILVANYQMTGSILASGIIRFNSDTGTNYSWTNMSGNGTSAASTRGTTQSSIEVGTVDSAVFVNTVIHAEDYANATTYKTILSRSNNTNYATYAYVGLWRSTSAVNSITFTHSGSSTNYFSTSSTFKLYGIQAVNS